MQDVQLTVSRTTLRVRVETKDVEECVVAARVEHEDLLASDDLAQAGTSLDEERLLRVVCYGLSREKEPVRRATGERRLGVWMRRENRGADGGLSARDEIRRVLKAQVMKTHANTVCSDKNVASVSFSALECDACRLRVGANDLRTEVQHRGRAKRRIVRLSRSELAELTVQISPVSSEPRLGKLVRGA